VISALNRSEPKIEGFQSFIQTDASINPGSSGGALVNMQGQLVAINTAILGPDANIGIGFAIPSNMVHSVIDQLLKYGKVQPGMLGVIAENVTADLADAFHLKPDQGTLVTQIMPGTPAEIAGIKPEDVILKVDGKSIKGATQLRNTLGLMRPGTKIDVALMRNNRLMDISATVGDPNAAQKTRVIPFISGMRLRDFNELQGDGMLVKGVLITQISDMSPGALAGLQAGDIVISANQQQVTDVQDLLHVVSEKPHELLLKINRNNSDLFLVINS
jgi:serine protease Do